MAIVTALSIAVLLAFAAIAIDIGHGRQVKGELQNAADAAALAAITQLDLFGSGLSAGRLEAVRIAGENEADGTPIDDLDPNHGNAGSGDVVLGRWDFVARTFDPTVVSKPARVNAALVRTERAGATAVDTWFGGVLGLSSFDVRAQALAARGGPRCANGMPLLLKECALFDAAGNLACSGGLREMAPGAYGHGGVTDLGDPNASIASLRQIIQNYDPTDSCNVDAGDFIRLYDVISTLMTDIDLLLDPDRDGVSTPMTVPVPVIASAPNCSVRNMTGYRVMGFADIELISVTPPNRWIRFRVICGRTVPERSGSMFYGIGARGALVK